jgi:hypothetical protein
MTPQGEAHSGVGPRERRGEDALRGALLALPALALALPVPGLLESVPTTDSAAPGWILLLLLPALGLTALTQRASWGRAGLAASVLGLAALASQVRTLLEAGDPFEAERATVGLWAAAGLVMVGSRLGSAGRQVLFTALAGLPLLLALGSLWVGHPAGLAGNAGDAAEAALPAAVLALAVFAQRAGAVRATALGSVLAYAGWTAWSEVRIASLGFLAVAGLVTLISVARPAHRALARIALVASLLVAVGLGGRALLETAPEAPAPAIPAAAAAEDAPEGGLLFRRLVWGTAPALLADHPLGVGPGQLARAYPPYRDPVELESSEHGRTEPTPVDVEHMHMDALNWLAEQGLAVGGALVLLLLLAGVRALQVLLASDAGRTPAALGVLAALATGLVNAPWSQGVLAPAVGLPLLGVLFAPDRLPSRRGFRLGPEGAVLAFALAHATSALAFVRHGSSLAGLAGATVMAVGPGGVMETRLDPIPARAAVRAALEATPTSVEALTRSARLGDLSPAEQRGVLERILELRPHRRAALIDLANLEARDGRLDRAATLQARARDLDPDSPLLARNALVLALDRGDAGAVEEAVAEVLRLRAGTTADLGSLLTRRLLAGEAAWCGALAEGSGEPLDLNAPVACLDAARQAREAGREAREQALLVAAHAGFAADSAARGDTGGAVRSQRQAARASARGLELLGGSSPRGAELVRLGLAGALSLDGQLEEARAELDGLVVTATGVSRLPAPLAEGLLALGVLRSQSQ